MRGSGAASSAGSMGTLPACAPASREERAEDLDGEEVPTTRRDPACAAPREPAAGHDRVDMRVERDVARPGVQHHRDAELGAEPPSATPSQSRSAATPSSCSDRARFRPARPCVRSPRTAHAPASPPRARCAAGPSRGDGSARARRPRSFRSRGRRRSPGRACGARARADSRRSRRAGRPRARRRARGAAARRRRSTSSGWPRPSRRVHAGGRNRARAGAAPPPSSRSPAPRPSRAETNHTATRRGHLGA